MTNNPALNHITNISDKRLFATKRNICPPFSIRVDNMMSSLEITRKAIRPTFSYRILRISTPTWMINPPPVNLDLQIYPKATTPTNVYCREFSKLLEEQYPDSRHIYTDGSKTIAGVGAAAVCGATARSATLPQEASVFSAEVHALELAISIIKADRLPKYTVFSDSLSALTQLKTLHYTHPALRKLQHDLFTLSEAGQAVDFCWIPGHAGIRGNEQADAFAKLASTHQEQFITIHYRDWYPIINSLITSRWNDMWQQTGQKMLSVKPSVGEWDNKFSNRRDQVFVNRLCTGHTRVTHNHLMDADMGPFAQPCPCCHQVAISVKHLLLECNALAAARRTFLNPPFTLQRLLTDLTYRKKLIAFGKHTGSLRSCVKSKQPTNRKAKKNMRNFTHLLHECECTHINQGANPNFG